MLTDDFRMRPCQLEARDDLRKHLRRRQEAQREWLVAHGEVGIVDTGAAGIQIGRIAIDPPLEGLIVVQPRCQCGHSRLRHCASLGQLVKSGILRHRRDLEDGFDVAQVFLHGALLQALQAIGGIGRRYGPK
jgi:hypothetical protein